MKQINFTDHSHLFKLIPSDKYDQLTKEEVIQLHKSDQSLIIQMQKALDEAYAKITAGEQKSFLLEEQAILIKSKIFGRSSEKSARKSGKRKDRKSPRKRVQLPSERYPNVDILEKDVTLDDLPSCPCCSRQMQDSGLTEDSEYLTVIPRKFLALKVLASLWDHSRLTQ